MASDCRIKSPVTDNCCGIPKEKYSVGRTLSRLPVIYVRPEKSVNMGSLQIGHSLKPIQTEAFVRAKAT